MRIANWTCLAVAGSVLTCGAVAWAGPLGPTPYLSDTDSPFSGLTFSYFHRENFEDHLLNTPGVTASVGAASTVVGFSGPIIDSVDADDGSINGNGLGGDSFFASPGSTGVTFTFDAVALGALPTHAGLVWTDGSGTITFQAFGPGNVPLGTIGPASGAAFPDGDFLGGTAEDRFFGWSDPGGIASIFISNSSGGMEIDHLQYGLASDAQPVPLPPAAWMSLVTLAGMSLVHLKGARRST